MRADNLAHRLPAVLYPSCFDANGGLFESILTSEDAVISDELNHASIIDGIRLCKAQRKRSGSLAVVIYVQSFSDCVVRFHSEKRVFTPLLLKQKSLMAERSVTLSR